ncbi:TetR/AcrR family transcriptional regulator C-terminal domain-containing protein [Nocardioides sp. P86]|uniref:TetR/AcrR family transcriptional regulator C-terminal domain-containing protein n=2 Tax=Nocardioides TaxID=1839 RepID=UPI002040438E|nr:TetR/AcrR family transcriptional regulator C-terminal domain-containing protein [Nocardioides sp. P86]MCM3514482.1 TetR/AcrR family transcriptional regulator C-terminal domain-containing protein [Nocardioides sp. P86]
MDDLPHLLDRLRAERRADPGAAHCWQDHLQRLAHDLRRVALARPEAFATLATAPAAAPGLRPPLGDVDWVEEVLVVLVDGGFDDAAAVAAYRAFVTCVLGHLLLEASLHAGGPDSPDSPGVPGDPAARGRRPVLDRLGASLAEDHDADEFDDALEAVLARMEALRAEH